MNKLVFLKEKKYVATAVSAVHFQVLVNVIALHTFWQAWPCSAPLSCFCFSDTESNEEMVGEIY